MRIKFHNWFRNKQSWWFSMLPEATITYASLGGMTTTTIQIGWLFWTMVVHLDNGMEKFFTNTKED